MEYQVNNTAADVLCLMPYAFTEHGVLMLSNVLNSKRAVNNF